MDKQIRSLGIGPNKSNNTNMIIVASKATPWICYIKNQTEFNYTTWLYNSICNGRDSESCYDEQKLIPHPRLTGILLKALKMTES